jgi:hypothetical protein
MRIWNVHWAFHPVSPSVLVDGMDIHNAEYGVWRPVYRDHAYEGLALSQITVNPEFAAQGERPWGPQAAKPPVPVDDLPPATVITNVQQADAHTLVVRGTTSDNGTVVRVVVNGHPARSVRSNFAEWEVSIPGGKDTKLSAHAEDAAGNVEKRPHVLVAE